MNSYTEPADDDDDESDDYDYLNYVIHGIYNRIPHSMAILA